MWGWARWGVPWAARSWGAGDTHKTWEGEGGEGRGGGSQLPIVDPGGRGGQVAGTPGLPLGHRVCRPS